MPSCSGGAKLERSCDLTYFTLRQSVETRLLARGNNSGCDLNLEPVFNSGKIGLAGLLSGHQGTGAAAAMAMASRGFVRGYRGAAGTYG